MTRVKICGNRTLQDVRITQGADAQGFIVGVPRSPRSLAPQQARQWIQSAGVSHSAVLVTTLSDPERLAALVDEWGLGSGGRGEPHALQLHTELPPTQLRRIRERVPGTVHLWALIAVHESAEGLMERAKALVDAPIDALLLDTEIDGASGGTGVPHNWEISRTIREAVDPFPVILAGGLTAENARTAIETVRPYAIDVSSGVEENGVKSLEKVDALLGEVRRCG